MDDVKRKISKLEKKIKDLVTLIDLPRKKGEITSLEKEMNQSDFWQDQVLAKETTKKLANLKKQVEKIEGWQKEIEDAEVMIGLLGDIGAGSAEADNIEAGNAEAQKEAKTLKKEVEKIEKEVQEFETELFLSGPHDQNEAILSIHAGEGGTEAMDWASMILRMYIRFAEKKNWPYELMNETPGEEAGIKSATMAVRGELAYGFLKGEAGTHRLVRLSPFDADNLRHTSFVQVEVLPYINEEEVELDSDELEFEAFRSSGHGGQNVNKVSTAVRLRHKPTGITVTSQSQRSQHKNRLLAESLLRAKLWQRQQAEIEGKKKKLKGEYKPASWGYQIRSYVLHPYQLVKDLRTGYETTDTAAVLDGEIDGFIETELKMGQ